MRLVLGIFAALALSCVPAATAAVGLTSITSPVHAGSTVTLVARAATTSQCSMRVHYGTRRALTAPGLYAKAPLFTVVRWSWKMPPRSTRGRWSVDVSCGTAGALHTTFVVR